MWDAYLYCLKFFLGFLHGLLCPVVGKIIHSPFYKEVDSFQNVQEFSIRRHIEHNTEVVLNDSAFLNESVQ